MTRLLESYAAGRWYAAADEGEPAPRRRHRRGGRPDLQRRPRPRRDGRTTPATVGGPALRGADLPRAGRPAQGAGQAPHRAQGRVLRRCRSRTGATQRDSMVDIDGGIGTVFCYRLQGRPRAAQRHRRPRRRRSSSSAAAARSSASTSTPRGPASRCRSTPSTSRSGACSRSSRRPSSPGCRRIVKPASQTAYLTELVVRRIIESGLLPEGSLQLLCRQRRRPARRPRPCRTRWRSPARRTPPACCAHHPSVLHGGVQPRRRGRLAQLLDPRPRRDRRTTRSSTCSSRASSPR